MEGECGRVVLGEGGRHHIINFKFFCPRTDLNFELTVDGDIFTFLHLLFNLSLFHIKNKLSSLSPSPPPLLLYMYISPFLLSPSVFSLLLSPFLLSCLSSDSLLFCSFCPYLSSSLIHCTFPSFPLPLLSIPSLPPVLLLILNVRSYFLCMIINHIQNPIHMIASRSSLYH